MESFDASMKKIDLRNGAPGLKDSSFDDADSSATDDTHNI
jgi:hypothetical protein